MVERWRRVVLSRFFFASFQIGTAAWRELPRGNSLKEFTQLGRNWLEKELKWIIIFVLQWHHSGEGGLGHTHTYGERDTFHPSPNTTYYRGGGLALVFTEK
uniref:Putative secreted protein n=1 Tax=Anopheles triannulatus TaxID=58253 RepID=A0A2M4B2M5_9DIPT